MIKVQVTVNDAAARSFLVKIEGGLRDRRALHEALALRLAEELKAHFIKKNAVPNRMGAPRTNFWQEVADATQVAEVSESGATVAIAEARYRLHLFGGTVVPKKAKALTIPLVIEARGESAASYQLKMGRRLFSIPGRKALFEKTDAAATESLTGATKGRVRGKNRVFRVGLAARAGIRPVFALSKKATIKQDPAALPPPQALLGALQEQANDYLAAIQQGGPA